MSGKNVFLIALFACGLVFCLKAAPIYAEAVNDSSGYTLEDVGSFGGSGVVTHGMVAYEDYLYSIDNGDLAIYDIGTDPAAPALVKTVTVTNGNKIYLLPDYSGKIIITLENGSTHGFALYSLSDPLNPVASPSAQTQAAVRDIIVSGGTFAVVLQESVDSLYVYYLGSSTQTPSLVDVYSLNGSGISLAQDANDHLLFAGYTGSSKGIQVFNTSNPYSFVQKTVIPLNTEEPQSLVAWPDKDKLFAGVNRADSSAIDCFDYTDPANVQLVKRQTVSDQYKLCDMEWTSALLSVSLNTAGVLKTYLWKNSQSSFIMGPVDSMSAPAEIVSYFKSGAVGKVGESSIGGENYIYVPSGEVNEPVLNGSGKTRIVKILPPGSTGQVTLTMNINPAEAVNHGCNVTPAPGPHQYDSGTEINVYALPNEAAGWYFTDWSGDACGTDLIAHLVMDRDKTATANFAEFKLTVYRQAGAAGLLY